MKSVLITRSVEENLVLRNLLGNYFRIVELPLIAYSTLEFDQKLVADFDYIIVASKYAAKIVASLDSNIISNKKFFVVGASSKNILSNSAIEVAAQANNMAHLLKILPKELYKYAVYLSGDKITQDLPLSITRVIIYNTNYAKIIDQNIIDAIRLRLDYIVLYSQNCSKILLKLLKKYNLLGTIKDSVIIATGLKVAKIFENHCRKILYCKEGQQLEMTNILIQDAKITKYQIK